MRKQKVLWIILLALTAALGIATIVLAGTRKEATFMDGSIGYVVDPREAPCHIAFAVSFAAWLFLSVAIKKNHRT